MKIVTAGVEENTHLLQTTPTALDPNPDEQRHGAGCSGRFAQDACVGAFPDRQSAAHAETPKGYPPPAFTPFSTNRAIPDVQMPRTRSDWELADADEGFAQFGSWAVPWRARRARAGACSGLS